MTHAATFKSYHQLTHQSDTTDKIPAKAKLHYVIIAAILLALAVGYITVRIIAGSVDNSSNPVQQNSNSASPGSTQDTGAPTNTSGTPADRTDPAPSGSGGNTILNPDQP